MGQRIINNKFVLCRAARMLARIRNQRAIGAKLNFVAFNRMRSQNWRFVVVRKRRRVRLNGLINFPPCDGAHRADPAVLYEKKAKLKVKILPFGQKNLRKQEQFFHLAIGRTTFV